LLVYDAM